MPAFERLLKRWGFVKLSRYGLELTPEGRVMSVRPAVLDDGLGGKVVGWEDDDLAPMELTPWVAPGGEAPRPAAPAPAAPVPVVAPTPARAPSSLGAEVVAPRAQVDEDEWEWEIALARARAAAEETEHAARAPQARAPVRLDPVVARPTPVVRPASSRPAPASAPSRPAPTPAPSRPAPVHAPVVQPIRPIALTEPARRHPRPAPARPEPPAKSPSTPSSTPRPRSDERPRPGGNKPTKLTGVETQPIGMLDYHDLADPGELMDMTPPPADHDSGAVRFAKGTSPGDSTRVGVTPAPARTTGDHTTPNLSVGDYTTPDLPLGDRTSPGLAIGPARATATRPVSVPSLRGRPGR